VRPAENLFRLHGQAEDPLQVLQLAIDLAVADITDAFALPLALHRDDALLLARGDVGADVGRGDRRHAAPGEVGEKVLREPALELVDGAPIVMRYSFSRSVAASSNRNRPIFAVTGTPRDVALWGSE